MDSSFIGFINGYIFMIDIIIISIDKDIHPWIFIMNLWINFENNLNNPINNYYKSSIWDSEEGIHIFFHYYINNSGIFYYPISDPLINMDYQMKNY